MLNLLRRMGMLRGVLGGSRAWFWVWVVITARQQLKKLAGNEPQTVYTGTLAPGHALAISHLVEDRKGRVPRKLRKRSDLTL